MSYLRAYKEHQCKFIMRFQDLELGSIARSFALLQLPRMAELRHIKIDFESVPHEKITEIKYKDKAREKQRMANLGAASAAAQEKREAREAKRKEHERLEKIRIKEKERRNSQSVRKRKDEHFEHEMADLNREARLLKKLKKGLITEKEMNTQNNEAKKQSVAPNYQKGIDSDFEDDDDSGDDSFGEGMDDADPVQNDVEPVSAAGKHVRAMIVAKMAAKKASAKASNEVKEEHQPVEGEGQIGGSKRKRKPGKRGSKGGKRKKNKANADDGNISA